MRSPINRREFLSAALVGLGRKTDPPIAGGFVNEDWVRGHQLRDRAAFPRATFPRATRQIKIPIVIVGGGIAGLSAAWRLDKRGVRDFVVIEMASQAGGNSRSGENKISAYPWGAHYVPVPNRGAALVRELFEDLGLLRAGIWDERSLCHSPQERLFLHGRWQEDIEPAVGATLRDREQRKRFQDKVDRFRASGEFTIPMEAGARPSPLDSLSMKEWMKQQGFDSPYLNWYVDYACRDDYGARANDTSAWAAIHYFASREHDDKGPLTWPEGNGWIVNKLLAKLSKYVRTNAMVHRVSPEGRGWRVLAGDTQYIADSVIFAAPTFLAPYIIEGAEASYGIEYSPWLTANLTIERAPTENGFEMAWDNTIYDSPALGYVVATHQSLRMHIEQSVWTYYWSLADGTPAANRKLLLEKDWQFWKEAILHDLLRAHPDIRQCVSRIDIMRMGHAMARPVPGFLKSRTKLPSMRNLFFANSDLSGFSIFEEAQYRGVRAADRAMNRK